MPPYSFSSIGFLGQRQTIAKLGEDKSVRGYSLRQYYRVGGVDLCNTHLVRNRWLMHGVSLLDNKLLRQRRSQNSRGQYPVRSDLPTGEATEVVPLAQYWALVKEHLCPIQRMAMVIHHRSSEP